MRIKMVVEYDGTNYAGWQRQDNAPSVQQAIEEALANLLGEYTSITGAGRTDAGVHALGQVCHFDTDTSIPPERIAYALNFALPRDISIKSSEQVDDIFHARYSATCKWYRYSIYNGRQPSPLNRFTSCHIPYELDDTMMSEALSFVLGRHDFAAFAAAGSSAKTTVREIFVAECRRKGDFIYMDLVGSGFLYNMVRIIAGTLMDIGRGKLKPGAIKTMLETRERTEGGITADPKGLTLIGVFYESVFTYEMYLARKTGFFGGTIA